MKRTGKLIVLLATIVCLAAIVFTVSIQSSAATSISGAKISTISAQAYTGKAIAPAITVKYGSRTLTKGTHYTVRYTNNVNVGVAKVTVTGRGAYAGTKTASFYIVSPAVKGLAFKAPRQTTVYAYWTAAPKATGYQVWVYNTTARAYKLNKTTTSTGVTVTGLAAGSTNTIRVRPYNKLSNGRTVYGAFCPVIRALTVPADVSGAAQSAAKPTSATVSWKASAGANGYYVYLYDSSADKLTYKARVSGTTYTLTGLEPASTTLVKVRAYRTINGGSYFTGVGSAVTLKTLPSTNVTGLVTGAIKDNYVQLKWDTVPGATLYRIYQLIGTKWTSVATSTANSKVVTGLTNCTDYSFRVVTTVVSGSKYFNGAATTTVNATTLPQTVTNVKATAITNKSITLSWTAVSKRTAYQVYMLKPGARSYVRYGNTTGTSMTVSGLSELSAYSFRVRAYYKTTAGKYLYGYFSSIFSTSTDDSKIDKITVTAAAANVWNGSKVQCSVSVLPSYAANKDVTWSTSNSYAKVDANGVVTGMSAGYVYIYATAKDGSGIKGYVRIRVLEHATGISIENSDLKLAVNEISALTYEVLPKLVYNRGVTFASSDTSVATVSAYGTIKGIKAGTATITVTSKDVKTVKATCKVTVSNVAVEGVYMPSKLTIYAGQSYTVNPIISPLNASNKSFSISIANKFPFTTSSYISINGTTIKGVKATGSSLPGAYTMTVKTANGKTAECEVTVISGRTKVTGVKIEANSTVWYPGKTGSLTADVYPSSATDQTIIWSSSNNNIARVDSSGGVLAVYPGTATITATTKDGSYKATYTLKVNYRITASSVKLNITEINPLLVGKTATLKATVAPSNVNNSAVKWSSSSTRIATVTSSGVVTGINAGNVTITATADGGKVFGTCDVTVLSNGVVIKPGNYFENMAAGSATQLTASIFPATANQAVVWTSSNSDIATVTANGLVTMTGVAGGAYIYATSAADSTLQSYAIFRTDAFAEPAHSTADEIFDLFKTRINKIKTYDMPAFSMTNNVTFNDVDLATPTALVSEDDFISLFSDFAENETKSMAAVTSAEDFAAKRSEYWSTLPVKGYTNTMNNFDTSAVNMAADGGSSYNDNGATYTVKLVLDEEVFDTLPSKYITKTEGGTETKDFNSTAHGQIFDILYKDYIDNCIEQLNGMELSDLKMNLKKQSFKTTYDKCSVTLVIDKLTNKVIHAEYDMNVKVEVGMLRMTLIKPSLIFPKEFIEYDFIKSDVSFNVNSFMNIDFTY